MIHIAIGLIFLLVGCLLIFITYRAWLERRDRLAFVYGVLAVVHVIFAGLYMSLGVHG